MRLQPNLLERVANLFRAFAEPTRLAIIQEVKEGEMSVSEIVDRLPTRQANVSKQLKMLPNTRLVTRRKQGTRVLYAIKDAMAFELCSLVRAKRNRDMAIPAKPVF